MLVVAFSSFFSESETQVSALVARTRSAAIRAEYFAQKKVRRCSEFSEHRVSREGVAVAACAWAVDLSGLGELCFVRKRHVSLWKTLTTHTNFCISVVE